MEYEEKYRSRDLEYRKGVFQLEEGERRVPVCVKGAATQLEEVRRDLQITPSICYNRLMLLFGTSGADDSRTSTWPHLIS